MLYCSKNSEPTLLFSDICQSVVMNGCSSFLNVNYPLIYSRKHSFLFINLFKSKIYREAFLLQWSTWGSLFGVNPSSTAGLYVLEYVIYVLIAIFFAWISAIAVKVFAPYACGSGIPEVCNQVKDVFKMSFSA